MEALGSDPKPHFEEAVIVAAKLGLYWSGDS